MTPKYLCPKCGSEINLATQFYGRDLEAIDPVTGEPNELIESDRHDIYVRTYYCDNACGWKEDADAFDKRIEDEEEIEEDFPQLRKRYEFEPDQV